MLGHGNLRSGWIDLVRTSLRLLDECIAVEIDALSQTVFSRAVRPPSSARNSAEFARSAPELRFGTIAANPSIGYGATP